MVSPCKAIKVKQSIKDMLTFKYGLQSTIIGKDLIKWQNNILVFEFYVTFKWFLTM